MGLLSGAKKLGGKIKGGASAVGLGGYAEQFDVVGWVKDPKKQAKKTKEAHVAALSKGLAIYGAVQKGDASALTGEGLGILGGLGVKVSKTNASHLKAAAATGQQAYGVYSKGGAAGLATGAGVSVLAASAKEKKASKGSRAAASKAATASQGSTQIALLEPARPSEDKKRGFIAQILSIFGL